MKIKHSKLTVEKLPRGRPRDSNFFTALKDAAAQMGIPVSVLNMARAAGCPAFRPGGGVYRDQFEQWRKDNPNLIPAESEMMSKLKWDAAERQASAEIRQHKLAVLRRDVIPVREVKLKFTRAVVEAKKRFQEGIRTVVQEVGLKLQGTDEQIAWALERADKRSHDVLKELSEHEFNWVICQKCGEAIK